MQFPFFHIESSCELGSLLDLNESTSRHIIQVLRMQPDEKIQLTDGKGNLYLANIQSNNKKKCTVTIVDKSYAAPKPFKISIGISPVKNNSRFEWFLEKATEIGVSEIIPLLCSRTEKQVIKNDRLENILISAMLQSRQVWKPVLTSPKKIKELISQQSETIKLIAHCELDEKKNELTIVAEKKDTLILIGPEGDFTGEEISEALKNNFIPVALGDTRLRTETAGMVAATLLCIQR